MQEPILCVDIGGTSTKAALLRGSTLCEIQTIPTKQPAAEYAERLSHLIRRVAHDGTLANETVSWLGVAVAGFLDEHRDHMVYNSNLPWLEGFPLKEHLSQSFPEYDVQLEVDSNTAAMAEYRFGSGQGSDRFLCATCGTGLGIGMIIGGVPLRFAYGCVGDIGHTVVDRDGPLCACGGRGCAEALISAPVLAAQYREGRGLAHEVTLRDVIENARVGDETAIAVLKNAGEWLGLAIASMANTFFPDHVAIAGGLSAAGDLVLSPAEQIFRRSASILARQSATFTQAKLGSSATLIGAAGPFWERQIQ